MKKPTVREFEASAWVSNLMLACAVVVAATPVILGDRFGLIVSSVVTEATVLLQSVSISLQRLLS